MSEWKTVANTLKEDWFRRKARWSNIAALPFHLWDDENLLNLGECTEEPVEVDQHSFDLTKLDNARTNGESNEICLVSEPVLVWDGVKEYNMMVFPAILVED